MVDEGKVAGVVTMLTRDGHLAFVDAAGVQDVETGTPMSVDTIFQIYSMTKPITTVAAMMLYEEGCFQLDDPVAKYIPEFEQVKVWAGQGDADNVVDCETSMLIRHAMSHTSGLTYGFMNSNPVDALYRKNDMPKFETLEDWTAKLATIPLICQPGSQWNYSVSTDVLGRLVEIWSGMTLENFFAARLFVPLGMFDS